MDPTSPQIEAAIRHFFLAGNPDNRGRRGTKKFTDSLYGSAVQALLEIAGSLVVGQTSTSAVQYRLSSVDRIVRQVEQFRLSELRTSAPSSRSQLHNDLLDPHIALVEAVGSVDYAMQRFPLDQPSRASVEDRAWQVIKVGWKAEYDFTPQVTHPFSSGQMIGWTIHFGKHANQGGRTAENLKNALTFEADRLAESSLNRVYQPHGDFDRLCTALWKCRFSIGSKSRNTDQHSKRAQRAISEALDAVASELPERVAKAVDGDDVKKRLLLSELQSSFGSMRAGLENLMERDSMTIISDRSMRSANEIGLLLPGLDESAPPSPGGSSSD